MQRGATLEVENEVGLLVTLEQFVLRLSGIVLVQIVIVLQLRVDVDVWLFEVWQRSLTEWNQFWAEKNEYTSIIETHHRKEREQRLRTSSLATIGGCDGRIEGSVLRGFLTWSVGEIRCWIGVPIGCNFHKTNISFWTERGRENKMLIQLVL